MRYEYIGLDFDFGDLSELNRLSSVGWKVCAVLKEPLSTHSFTALLERPLPPA